VTNSDEVKRGCCREKEPAGDGETSVSEEKSSRTAVRETGAHGGGGMVFVT
jgi:hypothetical protein